MIIGPIHSLGIMQGRLLPKYQGRYQAHPVGYWQKEFELAAQRDLDYVEFILDYNDLDKNPLMSERGLREIQNSIQKTGVGVRSVCADYFMEAPLHAAGEQLAGRSREVLEKLIENAQVLGIKDIVIPCVDQSSLRGEADKTRFVSVINALRSQYEKCDVNMALETDLAPDDFTSLLTLLPSEKVTVNYDTGNSASLGYDLKTEFEMYGHRISDIHIKDRILHGGSVVLGTGNTRFGDLFSVLNRMDYKGIFVMQVYRDEEGLAVFDEQLNWLQETAEKYQ